MPSYDPSLFNVDPYYDDFSEDKKFLRLMFRPGYAVQARELTQIQTLLQNQIERFGSHIFEEGSIVLDGQISESRVKYAKVSIPTTVDHTDFIGTVISRAGRAKARVVHAEGGLSGSVADDESVLFFEYIEGGTGFQANDLIAATAANGTGITASVTGPNGYFIGDALVASVDRGVRFVEGFFVLNDAQSIGAYTLTGSAGNKIRNYSNPTTRIGFQVNKSFVTATEDTTLTDPAFGFYNYAAPGSDRFAMNLVVSQVGYTASDTSAVDNFSREGFIEFMRVVNGDVVKVEKYPDYAALEDTLARRTFDESGNYTVTPFELTLKGPTTSNSTTVLKAELSAGKAYVFGYEFETQANTRLDIPCARGSSHERTVNRDFNRIVGPFTKVTFSGIPDSFGKTADISTHPKVILSAGASGGAIQRIGTARIRSVLPYQSPVFDLSIYDIAITGASSFSDVTRIFLAEKDGTTKHLFNITGSAGLEREDQGCLVYQVPEGSGVTSFSSGDYAIITYASAQASSDPYHFTINSYAVSSPVMDFSVSQTPVSLPNADVMVFTEDGVAVGGTAARNPSSSTNLQLTVTGANGKKLIVIAAQEVQDDSQAMGSSYTKTKTLNTFSGTLTGSFGSSLTGDGRGSTSDVLYLNGYTDILSIRSLTGTKGSSTGINILPYFTFDSGQRDSHYDWGRLYLNPGVTGITGPYSATFTYYSHGGNRGPFTVRSYPDYENIPSYRSISTGIIYKLRDSIDFRPDRSMSGDIAATPWIPTNSAANDNDFTYTHFLPRTDKITITRDRKFSVISGVPSLNGDVPADDPNAMTLYTVRVNPYTFDSDDASVRYVENKRYTMRDIGNLEKRIEAVEYYTTLNLLEQEAKAKSIRDENGDEMPKRGILVDQFKGHAVADNSDPMFAASIDYENNELRPTFNTRSYGLTASSFSGITGNQNDGIYTLNYTTSPDISNLLASSYTTINPFSVITFLGSMKISPATDVWYDNTKQPKVRVNVEGENDNWKENSGSYGFGTRFNDWESIWFGNDIAGAKNARPNLVRNKLLTTKTEGLSVNSISSSIAPESMKKVVNSKVVARDVLPVARERTINVSVTGLRPNTPFRVYCDEVDVTTTCTGGEAITDPKGQATFKYLFNHPNSNTNFLVGRHTIRVTDGTDINTPSSWLMSAEATYSVEGAYNSIAEDGQLCTRVLETRRKSVKSDRVVSNLSEMLSSQGEVRGYNEPLSQTFYVDPVKHPNGVFVKFVDLFFNSKESLTTIPVTVQIRPTLSGYPHPSKVLPFATSTLYSDSITNVVNYISSGDNDSTRFNFTTPVYLLPGNEYAISISSNSGNYSVLTGSLGSTILTANEDDPKINITKQPMMRGLFKSQNTGKLVKNENETLAFRLGLCKFGSSGTVNVVNEALGATASLYVNQFRLNAVDVVPEGTNIGYTCEIATTPVATNLGDITPNKNIEPPTGVYNIPSSNTQSGLASVTISMTRPGSNEYVSPIFDMEKSSIVTVTNLINNQIDSSVTGPQYNGEVDYVNTASQFKTAARYISKKVTLEDGMEAQNITVTMSLCNPKKTGSASSIQVFVRPVPVGETDPDNVKYVQLTSSDGNFSSSDSDFREVSFTNIGHTTLPKFKTFSIKVVMFGQDDGSAVPRIRNLRMIAT